MQSTKPARVCLEPHCGRLVRGASRCTEHQQAYAVRHEAARGTPAQRGYGPEWHRLSRQVLARDGYVCAYCGAPATTVDHVVAKANGGGDSPSNLVSACRRCNSAKGAR